MILNKTLVALSIIVIFSACTKDREEVAVDQTTTPGDSTTVITYKNDVKAIIDANCVVCHSTGGQNPELTNYTSVQAIGANGKLKKYTIDYMDKPMPPTGAISSGDRQTLTDWIQGGLKEQ